MTTTWIESWEDYPAGMYRLHWSEHHVMDSIRLLADTDRFYDTATEMLQAWPNSAVHNLVYLWTGRNAWIGQASCLYAHNAPSGATREAWGMISNDKQRAANTVARCVREEWEDKADGRQTLFGL